MKADWIVQEILGKIDKKDENWPRWFHTEGGTKQHLRNLSKMDPTEIEDKSDGYEDNLDTGHLHGVLGGGGLVTKLRFGPKLLHYITSLLWINFLDSETIFYITELV